MNTPTVSPARRCALLVLTGLILLRLTDTAVACTSIMVGKKALSLETDNEKMRKYLKKQLIQYQKQLAESR